jgi:hypothetical protein
LRDGDWHRSERFVDFNPVNVREFPTRPFKRDVNGRHWPEPKHARLDCGNTECDESGEGFDATRFGEATLRDQHGRCAAVQAWRIASSDRPVRPKSRTKFRKRFDRCVWTRRLVPCKAHRPLAPGYFHGDYFGAEEATLLRRGKALL